MRTTDSVVVADTGIFSAVLVRQATITSLYSGDLVGKQIILSFQTVAELRYGAIKAGWGPARVEALEQRIGTAAVVSPNDALVNRYARLRYDCASQGLALGQKAHDGDRWIAATALQFGLVLVSHDTIFKDVPSLNLVTHA